MRFGLAVLVVAVLAGCTSQSNEAPAPSPSGTTAAELLPGEDWVLMAAQVTPDPVPFDVTVRFENGQLSGKAPVNRYSGTVTASQDGTFAPGAIASTEMAGPAVAMTAEQSYFDALDRVTRWEVNDQQLSLATADGPLLTFAAPGSPGAFAVTLVGQPRAEAKAAARDEGYEFRVLSVDGDQRPATMDYRPDRINVTIVDGTVTQAGVG